MEPTRDGFLTGTINAKTRFGPKDFCAMVPRFSPENLAANMPLVELLRKWAERKEATPGQISLALLLAQKPWVVPIPGTTKLPHLLENLGADSVELTAKEVAELNASLSAIKIHGLRLPKAVLGFSGVDAPPKSEPGEQAASRARDAIAKSSKAAHCAGRNFRWGRIL